MNRCTVFDKLEDEYGIKHESLTEREKAIIGLCTNDVLEHEEQTLCLHPVSNAKRTAHDTDWEMIQTAAHGIQYMHKKTGETKWE